MKTAIIVSEKDPAGMLIREVLLKLLRFKETDETFSGHKIYTSNIGNLYTTDKDSISCENIDKEIQADLFIFATKHQSAQGTPVVSCHSPGNWGKAEMGGLDNTLSIAPAVLLSETLKELERKAFETQYEAIQECTHHGPFTTKPTMFIEIGSSPKEWQDRKAAEIIVQTIHHVLTMKPTPGKIAFGIGGLHHTPNFRKLIIKNNYSFGHVCPKYMLESLNKEMISQAILTTQGKVEEVVLDWKGLKTEKQRIVSLLNEMNIEYTRV